MQSKLSGAYKLSARLVSCLTANHDAYKTRTCRVVTPRKHLDTTRTPRNSRNKSSSARQMMGLDKLKTVDERKARKPLLERKRRARINESLSELKAIVLQSLNKDSSRYTKMEKADILEMAVKHLKALRETVNGFSATDGASRYRDGFNQCASEVSRYVMTMDSIDHNTRSDILSHLNTTCKSVYMPVPLGPTSPPLSPLIQSRLFSEPPQTDLRYHVRPVPYPLPPFMSHPHPRHEHTANDVTHLARNPGYHPPTFQFPRTPSLFSRETSTVTKATLRPDPVWRPW